MLMPRYRDDERKVGPSVKPIIYLGELVSIWSLNSIISPFILPERDLHDVSIFVSPVLGQHDFGNVAQKLQEETAHHANGISIVTSKLAC
jgi:hypothetical protein